MRGVWRPQDQRRHGPRELTGIADLTRGKDHPTARLLDLIPDRPGTVYKSWLAVRGEDFRAGARIATLDPFQGYNNAIDDRLQDTISFLDAFRFVKLAGDGLDEVRRRVEQDTLGHRGRKGDPPTRSVTSCMPVVIDSPSVNGNDSTQPSLPTRRTSVSKLTTAAPSRCTRSFTKTRPRQVPRRKSH